jgi:hypothetical protein
VPTPKKVHYEVLALTDGTILIACPGRKPPRTRQYPEKEDEDGVCRRHVAIDHEMLQRMNSNPFGIAAVALNVKKALRTQVESRLGILQQQVVGLKEQLARIEGMLGRMMGQ